MVIAAVLVGTWPLISLALDGKRAGKGFYVASESMRPTLEVNDRIVPRTASTTTIRRGSVAVIAMPDVARIYRVAAIGGDRVAVRNGTFVINGLPCVARGHGRGPNRWERLPGEATSHRIMNLGQSVGDDLAEVQVPAGRLFLLGDNRDRSADSRFGSAELGVGFVDEKAVIGTVTSYCGERDGAIARSRSSLRTHA